MAATGGAWSFSSGTSVQRRSSIKAHMLSALFCSGLLSSIPLFFMRRPWHATNFPLHFLKK